MATSRDAGIDNFEDSNMQVPEIVAKQEYDMAVSSQKSTQAMFNDASNTLRSVSDQLQSLLKDYSSEKDAAKKALDDATKLIEVSKTAYDTASASMTSAGQAATKTAAASTAALGAFQKAQLDAKNATDANAAAVAAAAKAASDLAAATNDLSKAQAARFQPAVYFESTRVAQAQTASTNAANMAKKAGDDLTVANNALKSTSDAMTDAVAADNAAIKANADAKTKFADAKKALDNATSAKALADVAAVEANLKYVMATTKYKDQKVIVDYAQRKVDDLAAQLPVIEAIIQERKKRLDAIRGDNSAAEYGLLLDRPQVVPQSQSQGQNRIVITPFENDASVEKHRLYNFMMFNILTFILGIAIILLMLHFME